MGKEGRGEGENGKGRGLREGGDEGECLSFITSPGFAHV